MARIVRLTERDLTRLVKRVIQETGRYGSFGNLKRKDFKGDQYIDDMDRYAKDADIYNIGDDDDFETEKFDNYDSYREKYPEDDDDSPLWFGTGDMGKRMFNTYREKTGKPFKVKTRRSMTESDLGRITRRVIMEEESAAYHMFVEKLDDIEEDMKKKNMTDEDLDDIREELENEKSSSKDSNNGLSGIEIKKLNKRINSLITKLKGKYKHERFEPMRVKSRIGMD